MVQTALKKCITNPLGGAILFLTYPMLVDVVIQVITLQIKVFAAKTRIKFELNYVKSLIKH